LDRGEQDLEVEVAYRVKVFLVVTLISLSLQQLGLKAVVEEEM
tara:strand:+ start:439 stop:567 length:129 start_codon:yes stop_codon:yes gene_type:complete